MSATANFLSIPAVGAYKIVAADTTTLKTLFTAGASGSRLDSINVVNDDVNPYTVQLWLTTGGVDYPLIEVVVAAGVGINGVVPVELLQAAKLPVLDNLNLSGSLNLKAGTIIKVSSKATVAAGKAISLVAFGVDA